MEIQITLSNYRGFTCEAPARFSIGDRFTAFVGPNNSGKSSLLRFFYEFRQLFDNVATNSSAFMAALGNIASIGFPRETKDNSEIFSNESQGDLTIDCRIGELHPADASWPKAAFKHVAFIFPRAQPTNYRAELYDDREEALPLQNRAVTVYQDGPRIILGDRQAADRFGSLNSINAAFTAMRDTLYVPSFRNAVNVGTREDYFDIGVGQSFIAAWKAFKTGETKKDIEDAHAVTEEIRRVFGFGALEIDAAATDDTLILFIDGRSYRLDEMGSGIAQFVVTLINAARKRPAYILIDEPEISLHPSLQLDFLTTLGSYAKHGVLFATHSVGLARSAAEEVFTTVRQPTGAVKVRPYEATSHLAEFLGELGFAGYRELGFTSVLLVEGVTDVKTF